MEFKIKLLAVVMVFAAFISCQSKHHHSETNPKSNLFKVSILYPNEEDKTFDMTYYEKHHMPMVANFIGDNLKFYEIDKGISGRTDNDKATYIAVGYFYVTDINKYNNAIGQNIDTIINDIKNYTAIQPIIQVSEIITFNPITEK